MASFFRFAARHSTISPVIAAAAFASSPRFQTSSCDASVSQSSSATGDDSAESSASNRKKVTTGMRPDAQGDFHGLFPKRQLWQPKNQYPMWEENWDGLKPVPTGDKQEDHKRKRLLRKKGVTRHIILIRHGQYDETHKEDEKRILTPLGRQQADATGKRIAELIRGVDDKFSPCQVKVLRVSNLARAKETADIIASHLPGVERSEPDSLLNEGRPCHTIPGGKASSSTIEKTDEGHARIEEAYAKYFYRAPEPESFHTLISEDTAEEPTGDDEDDTVKHEYEIYVGHANVIRYFFCRALQLPPEAWLRLCTFNCSLTYLTIRPTGSVSCRMLGDTGHLPYNLTSFSHHHGYNW